MKQRINFKYSQEIDEILKYVCEYNTLKKTVIFKRVKLLFNQGREDDSDDVRSWCPSTLLRWWKNIDSRFTTRMFAEELDSEKPSIHTILTKHLGLMKTVCQNCLYVFRYPIKNTLTRIEYRIDWKKLYSNFWFPLQKLWLSSVCGPKCEKELVCGRKVF